MYSSEDVLYSCNGYGCFSYGEVYGELKILNLSYYSYMKGKL